MTIAEDLAASAATIDARLAALLAEAQAIDAANAAGTASRAVIQEVADLLRTWAPLVAALEQGGGGTALADALAQVESLTQALSDANATIAERDAALAAAAVQIADLQAALAAALAGGGGEPTGTLIRVTGRVRHPHGGSGMFNTTYRWDVVSKDGTKQDAYGTVTTDNQGVFTLQFTSPSYVVGDSLVIRGVRETTEAEPFDRTISGFALRVMAEVPA